jgi:hypothetical protein
MADTGLSTRSACSVVMMMMMVVEVRLYTRFGLGKSEKERPNRPKRDFSQEKYRSLSVSIDFFCQWVTRSDRAGSKLAG